MLSASRLAIAMKAAITLFLVLATLTWAQSANSHPAQPVPKSQSTSSARNWRTPKEQLWCSVLESALGGAAAADPPMRSYLLDAVATGLSKCEPGKVRPALVDSFAATLAMPENEDIWQRVPSQGGRLDQETREALYNLETKRRLQEVALTQLLSVDELKAESLLPQSEPEVRAEFFSWMISRAIHAKKFDRALQLLGGDLSKENFPYKEATQLMLELPPEHDTDKQEVFQLALASDHEQPSRGIGGDDFAGMIVRFWQHIPPALVLAAIHQVLEEARQDGSGVTLNAASGKVGFTSEHDYRVFELLPVLRQLDDEEADKILKDSQQAQLQLKQFPNGIQSLDPMLQRRHLAMLKLLLGVVPESTVCGAPNRDSQQTNAWVRHGACVPKAAPRELRKYSTLTEATAACFQQRPSKGPDLLASSRLQEHSCTRSPNRLLATIGFDLDGVT
jgi:hypothetical protein